MYSGPFQPGDKVQLTDAKRRHFTIELKEGGQFHSHKGIVHHDDIIGADEGSVVKSTLGSDYLCFRHLLVDHVLSMPRGAAVIYPKDAGQIVTFADVMASDSARFNRFFHLMLDGGVYLAPSAFEAGFTSIAHGDKELAITLDAAERAFAELKKA